MKTPAKERERQRAWRERNKERISAYSREYAKANRGRRREIDRRYKERHRAELAAKERARQAAKPPEQRKAEKQEEYCRNVGTYRAHAKRHYTAHSDEEKRKARAWVKANPERRRAYLDGYRPRARELYDPLKQRYWNSLRRNAAVDPAHARILRDDPCAYCGGACEHIDHIHPVVRGGGGEWENLTAACASCNSRKHAQPLLVFLHGLHV